MPRKPIRTPEEIYEALKGLNFLQDDGNMAPWNDVIWDVAVKNLDYVISKDYLWTYLKENRNSVFNKLHNLSESELSKKKKGKSLKMKDLNYSMPHQDHKLQQIRRSFHLTKKEWNSLGPHRKEYSGRSYEVLEPGWADKIYYHIWKEFELPCAFAFTSRINDGADEVYLKITGFCHECRTEIHLYSETSPTDEGINIVVSAWDTRDIIHKKRRQLRGSTRKRVATEVASKSTYMWRRECANKEMKFGGVEPAFLYSEEVLRKAKEQKKNEELNVRPAINIIDALRDLKKDVEFSESIRDYCETRVFAMYWLPEQITLNNEFLKKDPVGSISYDASGHFCLPVEYPGQVIYLYQAVADFQGKTLPLFQMISSRHDANWIAHWLREIIRSGAHPPKQFVSDFSLALLNGGSLAFNERRLTKFIDDCFHQLLNGSEVPEWEKMCLLRLDIAHLIKLVIRWTCFKNNLPLKHFYLRCVGILTNQITVDEFKRLLTDILCIAFSEQDGSETDLHSCHNARQRLINMIKSQEIEPNNDANHNIHAEFDDFEASLKEEKNVKRPIIKFLEEIEKDAKKFAKPIGMHNPYYSPDFGTRLLGLSEYFVLWTAVMPHLYNNKQPGSSQSMYIATSARSESYFRTLRLILNDTIQRIDKVMKLHMKALSGTVKLQAVDQEPIRAEKRKQNQVFGDSTVSLEESNVSECCGDESSNILLTKLRDLSENDKEKNYDLRFERLTKRRRIYVDSEIVDDNNNESECDDYETNIPDNDTEFNNDDTPQSNTLLLEKTCETPPIPETTRPKHASTKIEINSTEDDESSSNEVPSSPKFQRREALKNINLNVNSHLKEVENWKGLNKKKHRGIYLKSCPDIENKLLNPKIHHKLPLLINGSSLPSVDTNIGKLKIRKTCAFDTLAHVVRCGILDFITYQKAVQESNSNFLQFVKSFSESGPSQKLYRERANLLLTIMKPVDGTLNCECNIGVLAGNLFQEEESLTRTIQCLQCEEREEDKLSVLDLNLKPLYKNGIKGLQASLDLYKDESFNKCGSCKRRREIEIVGGHHLVIDIESFQWKLTALVEGHVTKYGQKISLKDIPSDLIVQDSTYRLVGAIQHTPNEDNGGHYKSYVRRLTGIWEGHDGLSTKSVALKLTKNDLVTKKTIHILYYVKI